MALHRDIFWIGRQWAVTGHGMQLIDQRLEGTFDIEVIGLWDDDLLDGVSGERWFNLEDFSKALALARARYPEPPHRGETGRREIRCAARRRKREIHADVADPDQALRALSGLPRRRGADKTAHRRSWNR